MNIAVHVGKQNGKPILVGMMSAHEIIAYLESESLAVNASAQRSLARGQNKETTKELIEDDRVHTTPRMKSFTEFLETLMAKVEEGQKDQGFFGAIQLVIPDKYKGARLRVAESGDKANLPGLALLQNSVGRNRQLATLNAEPARGETLFHIGDGQGRCVGFYSFDRVLTERVTKQRKHLKKLEANREDSAAARRELERLEALKERGRKFLSQNDVPFVIYVADIKHDGEVVGLSEEAEKRLYIEGNALNSLATKEEILKFETFSPVVIALQEDREEPDNFWMTDDFVEADSKSISVKSTKVFTLSTLVQAYSWSAIGSSDAISTPTSEMISEVGERRRFIRAFWKKISEIFAPIWAPPGLSPSDRLTYLTQRRNEQNVAFTAVFLQALGRLGYTLGTMAQCDPESPLLSKLELLKDADFRVKLKDEPIEATDYNMRWATAMMKPKPEKEPGKPEGFVFNNTRDTIANTHDLLCRIIDLSPTGTENEAKKGQESEAG